MNRSNPTSKATMRKLRNPFALLGMLILILTATPVSAAFLLEIDVDGNDDGVIDFNSGFSFGGDTTMATPGSTSLAYGTTGGDSIFGGDGVNQLDNYMYVYSPDSQADNLAIPPGTDLGEGNLATGATGGGAGTYSVYATWPFSSDVSGGLTEFSVSTGGDSFTVEINQNDANSDVGTDGRGDVWVMLGQIDYVSGDITVTQLPTDSNTFVSQRSHGLLFEAVTPTGEPPPPAPATAIPVMDWLGLTILALLLMLMTAVIRKS